jgi:hypothetical protein
LGPRCAKQDGPLLSLVEQIFNVWQVRENILTAPGNSLSPGQVHILREFFWEQYFAPLHSEIAALLKTKLYLLEGVLMPDSFARYLEHATQEACQYRLWKEHQIDTKHVSGLPWPEKFDEDVRDTLRRLMEQHQSGVEELSLRKDPKPKIARTAVTKRTTPTGCTTTAVP